MGLVQTSGKKTTSTGGASVVFHAPAPFTVGNWVVVAWETNPYKDSITGGGGVATNEFIGVPFGSQIYGISWFQVTNASTDDVTFNFTPTSGNTVTCSFEEWDNFQGATPLDTSVEASGTSVSSGTLAQANEVVYAIAVPNGTGGTLPTGPSSGFTQTWAENTSGIPNGAAGYKSVSSTASVTATFTNVGDCIIVTFKSTGGGGGGTFLAEAEWHPLEQQTNPLTVSVWG